MTIDQVSLVTATIGALVVLEYLAIAILVEALGLTEEVRAVHRRRGPSCPTRALAPGSLYVAALTESDIADILIEDKRGLSRSR